jgi:hypothetical protein
MLLIILRAIEPLAKRGEIGRRSRCKNGIGIDLEIFQLEAVSLFIKQALCIEFL